MFDWVTGNVCCNLYGGGAPQLSLIIMRLTLKGG